MRLNRVGAAFVAVTAAFFGAALIAAAPAQAMNPCLGDNPPETCTVQDPGPVAIPPTAPAALAATSVLQSNVYLQWQDKATTETAYSVRRVLNGASTTSSLPANSTAFADVVPAGSTVDYYVSAVACIANGRCASSAAAHVSVTTHPAPASPSGHLTSIGVYNGYFYLAGWAIDWDTTAPINVAVILDGVVQSSNPAAGVVSGLNQTNPGYGDSHGFGFYLSKSAVKGTHQLCLRAINVGGGSDTDLYCTSYVTPGKPSAASDLTVKNTGTAIIVSFTDNANDEAGYYLQRSLDAGTTWLEVGSEYAPVPGVGAKGSATDVSSPPVGTCYRIMMTNAYGDSPSPSTCTA
ncbi:hypothetical protein SAMN05892883_3620 [Jatrophihabitans sp. GAS493]|uniref:hypothetical protein n=1 Tax=Jatrophihabitans sp. GAS493 TaxID=1907575 RepID=UPI000BB801BD|nr:hypothetical protein [Jatrophihabitans sp. GAS493]SOD74435.1 hypothetical protein SAMN05892883_3620 [Jatrophihabitans sp. GAS493]